MTDGRAEALAALATALAEAAKRRLFHVLRHVERTRRTRRSAKSRQQGIANSGRARRRRIADFLRMERARPCTDCGELRHGHMSFDHLPERGRKRFNAGDAASKSFAKVVAELAKCELTCCACHDRRERARGRVDGHRCTHAEHLAEAEAALAAESDPRRLRVLSKWVRDIRTRAERERSRAETPAASADWVWANRRRTKGIVGRFGLDTFDAALAAEAAFSDGPFQVTVVLHPRAEPGHADGIARLGLEPRPGPARAFEGRLAKAALESLRDLPWVSGAFLVR